MKTRFLCLPLVLALSPLSSPAAELPDTLVQKLLGVGAVHHEPSQYTPLDLVYKDAAGQTLFTLRLTEPTIYETWKTAAAGKAEPVAGVGDDAFTQAKLGRLCARSAKTAACVNALPLPGRPKISADQMAALVRAALQP